MRKSSHFFCNQTSANIIYSFLFLLHGHFYCFAAVAIVEINSNFGKYNIIGTVKFEQSYETDEELPTLKVTGTITGLPEGRHGFHVHEFGNTSDNCMAAGSHFNPYDVRLYFIVRRIVIVTHITYIYLYVYTLNH